MPLSGALSDRADRRTVAVAVFAGGVLGFPPVMQAYLMDRFADETMGRDFGGFKTAYLAVGSVGPAFVGYVADSWGYAPAYLCLAGCLVVAALVVLVQVLRQRT